MSTRILHDTGDRKACLYDSVTDTAFGPIFTGDGFDDAEQEAEAFCRWLPKANAADHRTDDPRWYSAEALMAMYRSFRREVDAGKVSA